MIAEIERAIIERAHARISPSAELRIEYRPEVFDTRRAGRGWSPDCVGSVALVAGRPGLLDELSPFAPREQVLRALDVVRAANLRELSRAIDASDIELLRARVRIASVLETYARPSPLGGRP